MIAVSSLNVTLGINRILSDISFILPDKHNMVLLGRSGSGKTVLMKTLLGIYTPDGGEAVIDGINIHTAPREQKKDILSRFAYVFQNAALLDSFTVWQNIALPLYERGMSDLEAIREKVLGCLATVGLEHTLNLYPSELSGGMKKRIGIARALVYNPQYLIFDEPVSGLDPLTAREIMNYIAKIAAGADIMVITITHETRNLEQICDRLLFLEGGKQLFFGAVCDFLSSKDKYIRDYLQ